MLRTPSLEKERATMMERWVRPRLGEGLGEGSATRRVTRLALGFGGFEAARGGGVCLGGWA